MNKHILVIVEGNSTLLRSENLWKQSWQDEKSFLNKTIAHWYFGAIHWNNSTGEAIFYKLYIVSFYGLEE